MYVNGKVPSANPYTFKPKAGEYDPYAASRGSLNRQMAATEADARKMRRIKTAATMAVGGVFGAGALAAAGAGGASLPAGATYGPAGFTAAPTGAAGAGMTLGKLWDIGNLGVQGLSSFFGQRSQNRGLDKQIALQQQDITARLAADAEARAEQKRQFEAAQANEARRFASEDEDRKFLRSRQEYDLQLIREREARQQVRRQRLAQFLGIG